MTRQLSKVLSLVALVAVAAGCAAGMAFRRGEEAARRSDWDAAVVHYREAVQADPNRTEFKIALDRSMLNASRVHVDAARELEAKGDLDGALREYRLASEYDPSNRQAAAKVATLDQTIRDRIEASRPKPAVQRMRERARQMSPEPVLNPASRDPLNIRFTNASVRDILNFIGAVSGINITFSSDYRDPAGYTVQIDGVTLEQALLQILSANQLFYKVLNERTILIIPDNAQNRAKYDEQVVRIFYLSHADATEVAQLLNTVLRVPGVAVIPTIAPNKTSNTITIRATAAMAAIMERVIDANDRPRAEVVLDVSIMEVNRAAREAVRPRSVAVLRERDLLARGGADGYPRDGWRRADDHGTAVQREYDLDRHQCGRLLPGGAAGDRALPRERHADEARRQAAAARAGGTEDHAEPGRRDPGAADHVRIVRRAGKPRDAANLAVQLQAGGGERHHDPPGDVRQRHRARVERREQHARGPDQHRRAEPAVLRHAQGRDKDPAARWGIDAACRPAARGRTPRPQRDHRPHSRAWPPGACSRATTIR